MPALAAAADADSSRAVGPPGTIGSKADGLSKDAAAAAGAEVRQFRALTRSSTFAGETGLTSSKRACSAAW
jgi:hypothetical protein